MSIPYPDKPWEDGQEFEYLLEDGTIVKGTYDSDKNAWEFVRVEVDSSNVRPPIFSPDEPTVYPGDNLVDNKLVVGDIWYDTTDPDGAVKHVYDGTQWIVDASEGFQTTATLPTAPGNFAKAIRQLAPYEEVDDDVPFQKDVNILFNTTNVKSALNLGRTSDLIDFTNNSVTQAYWVHTQVDEDQFPDEAEFWAYDGDGNETTKFTDIRKIIFNDNGISANPGTENKLQDVRVGDYLIMQEVNENHFGMYVISGITTYAGSIREFEVKVYKQGQRAYGDCQYFAHCSVRIIRPSYVVVQDDQPVASDRGILWYRESDDVLSISNYGDGFIGNGPQWTAINGTGSGGGDYLPLSGGSISGNLSVSGNISNVGGILLAGPRDSALRVYDTQGGQVFDVHCDKFGVGAQYYGAVELPNHIATKEYVDSVDLANKYLSLDGGTMRAPFAMGNNPITALADPKHPGQAANKR